MAWIIVKYLTLFAMSAVKFLFAAGVGWASGFSFYEIVGVTCAGGVISFIFFYEMASILLERAKKKRMTEGVKEKKKFTKLNKWMVKLKMSRLGFYLLVPLGPLFLSVPIGSIVVAKFYRDNKYTFWYGILSMVMWSFVLTFIWQFVG